MPKHITDLEDLMKRLNQNQLIRFQFSDKTLTEFLDSEDEKLITETVAVLAKLRKVTPTVEFAW